MPDQERKALAFLRVYPRPARGGEGESIAPLGATVESLVKISY